MGVGMRGAACIGTAVAVLLFPIAAQAKTKTVHMGEPSSTTSKFNKLGTDVDDFFPHGVTIRVGDKVRFVPDNFHTVDLPARGGGPVPVILPDGTMVSGAADAAGSPFWFNGQQNLVFNPALLKMRFGQRARYNGSKAVDSGLPLGNNLKPLTVKFKKAGRYTYFCDLHVGMKGVVRVVNKHRRIPSARADKKALKRQLKRDLRIAKNLGKTTPPAGTVDVGVHGAGGVEFFGFVPGNFSVKVGTKITFRMGPGSLEAHTATFGPGNPLTEPTSYLGEIEASFNGPGPFDPRAVYPSERPPTTGTLTQTSHGNGFWNSGAMDTVTGDPLPESNSVTFGQAGTYNYYCMIHPFMHGVITVTP